MQRVAIVDHGLCNVDSIRRAINECGAKAEVTNLPEDLSRADKIVLPGVGAFPDAMAALEQHGLIDAICEQALGEGVPLLGVCLGMQLLATDSVEVRPTKGLGLIPGHVERLVPSNLLERIPHVGWNEVHQRYEHRLLAGVADRVDFYFVHSFHFRCDSDVDELATTEHCGQFTSMVARGNVFGAQFHPEKSQAHGLRVLRNFVEL